MKFIEHTKDFVLEYFNKNEFPALTYHSLEHTLLVADKLLEISKKIGLSPTLLEQVVIAGLLHDIGYLHDIHQHEDKSIELAKDYLTKSGKSQAYIDQVERCIHSTKHNAIPTDELQALLKDTDLSYGLYTNFKERGDQLRQEWHNLHNRTYSDKEWKAIQVNFLAELKFYSAYGKEQFEGLRIAESRKLKN